MQLRKVFVFNKALEGAFSEVNTTSLRHTVLPH